MSSNEQNVVECPICYDEIDVLKNCVTTECGHQFHCSCLMKNSATNGFSCPMCRSVMAEELDSESDESDESEESLEDDDLEEIEDNALTSFRMFHQQLAGEEVEEEPLQEDEDNLSQSLSQSLEPIVKPTAALIAARLVIEGYTTEDLVKCLLLEHEEYEADADEHERCADQMFGKFRQIISNYPRERAEAEAREAITREAESSEFGIGQRHQSSRMRVREDIEINIGHLQNRYRALEASDNEEV